MTGSARAEYAALKRIWAQLPEKPMTAAEAREAIILAAGLRPGDNAGADARRAMLEGGGALHARQTDTSLVFVRGAFPDYVEAGPGTPAYNAYLARQAQESRELRERGEKRAEENQAKLMASAVEHERLAFNSHIDRRLRELGLLNDNEGSALAGSPQTGRP